MSGAAAVAVGALLAVAAVLTLVVALTTPPGPFGEPLPPCGFTTVDRGEHECRGAT